MGSRIARGDTAARERIAIASALHVGGTSGEKSRPPVHRGGKERSGNLAEPSRESESGVVSSSRKWLLRRDDSRKPHPEEAESRKPPQNYRSQTKTMVDAWMRCVLFVAIAGGVGAQGGGKPHLPLPLVQAQAASDVQTSTRSSLPLPASPPLLLLPLPTPPPPIWLLSPPPPWLPLMPPPCTVLPCTEASDVSRLSRGLQLTVPSHRCELQTYVSTVADLTSALANTAVGCIVLASGTYYLSSELSITRSVILEAAVAGSVVLDAQANSSIPRRVLNVNPGSLGVVQVIGLNVTRGYNNNVDVCSPKLSHRPMGFSHVLRIVPTGRRCCHHQRHGDLLIVHHHWQHSF